MLSRAVAVIRGGTLIVNLPGSPKAVRENLEYVIPALGHGLEILTGPRRGVRKEIDNSFRRTATMKKFFSVLLAALMLFTVAGCGASEPAPAPAESAQEAAPAEPAPAPESEPAEEPAASGEPVTILVAAAASLEYSYKDKLIPMFTEKYPWITVEGTYDSSGKLQTQIEEGLEADVFMSAATSR